MCAMLKSFDRKIDLYMDMPRAKFDSFLANSVWDMIFLITLPG